jgi:NAD(P)-dependent dehydrogenase (short-subunit alcohol dehydrogenase family)
MNVKALMARTYHPSHRMSDLEETVALVTGATRGAGRGVAKVLGEHGATVYLTGRSTRAEPHPDRPGTIEDTAEEVTARGGTGIPVRVDHREADEVASLIERIENEQGRLDLLVANAWMGYERRVQGIPFWEATVEHWDLMFDSLRMQMVTAQKAAPLMLKRGSGLIVNTLWDVGSHFHGLVSYDTVKTAVSRMSFGMGEQLREHGIAVVALSPGWMHTEIMDLPPELAEQTETTEYIGRAAAALAADPNVMRWSGQTLLVVDLAREYGFTDVDGQVLTPFWEKYFAEGGRTQGSSERTFRTR